MATKHPDSYFRFYPKDFFEAVDGYSNDVVAGYLRALSKYRGHFHCAGLPADDDDYLRRLCQIEGMNWARSKAIIFGHFFKLENGAWHQNRMREDYVTDCEEYQKQLARTETARANRWPESSVTETETESVTDSVTETVTMNATESATSLQPRTKNHEPRTISQEPETKSLSGAAGAASDAHKAFDGSDAKPKRKAFVPPSVEDCYGYASTIGLNQFEADKLFDYFSSKGWLVGRSPMKCWRAAMRNWKRNANTYGNQRSNTGAASSVKPAPGKYANVAIKA